MGFTLSRKGPFLIRHEVLKSPKLFHRKKSRVFGRGSESSTPYEFWIVNHQGTPRIPNHPDLPFVSIREEKIFQQRNAWEPIETMFF